MSDKAAGRAAEVGGAKKGLRAMQCRVVHWVEGMVRGTRECPPSLGKPEQKTGGKWMRLGGPVS